MLNGAGPLTTAIGVVAAAGASLLIYRDATRHGHYHAVSASVAVGVAALVGFAVANLVGLVVATGYVLLLYLLSYPSTLGVDGIERRRRPDRPDGTPRGDAGENITGADGSASDRTTRPADGAAAWNAAPAGDDRDAGDDSATERGSATASDPAAESDPAAATDGDSVGDWTTAAVDDDAAEVSAGSIDEWVTVGDGGENRAQESFDWAEVEVEE